MTGALSDRSGNVIQESVVRLPTGTVTHSRWRGVVLRMRLVSSALGSTECTAAADVAACRRTSSNRWTPPPAIAAISATRPVRAFHEVIVYLEKMFLTQHLLQ